MGEAHSHTERTARSTTVGALPAPGTSQKQFALGREREMDLEQKVKELVEQETREILSEFGVLQGRSVATSKLIAVLGLKVDPRLVAINGLGLQQEIREKLVEPIPGIVLTQPIEVDQTPIEPEFVPPKVSLETVDELPTTGRKSTPGLKEAGRKRAREAQKQIEHDALTVFELLADRPFITSEIVKLTGFSAHRLSKMLRFLKDEEQVAHNTRAFQGPTWWYRFDKPFSTEEFKDYINSLDKGTVTIEQILQHFHLDERSTIGVEKHLKGRVMAGQLTRREGGYHKEGTSLRKIRSGSKEARNARFNGGGVATSGDKLSSNKEVRALISKIKSQGAEVESTGGDHIRVKFNGKSTTIGSTPGIKGHKDDKSNLKAMGLNV